MNSFLLFVVAVVLFLFSLLLLPLFPHTTFCLVDTRRFAFMLHYVHGGEMAAIRDGDRMGRGRESEGSTTETARKGPERPWTAARTMEVLRRCPLAIAQRLVHWAIAVSTAVLDRVTKKCPLHCCWLTTWTTWSKRRSNLLSPAPPPYSWSLLGKIEGPAQPPSSKISWSFDLAWNPVLAVSVL